MECFLRNLIFIFLTIPVSIVGQPVIGHAFLDDFQGKCGALEKSQIWQITSGYNDYVFFASSSGLGIYDGVRWELNRTNENLILRSLYYDDSTKTLFSGAVNQFGKWQMNRYGMFEYTPLWKNDKNSTIEFWRTASLSPDSRDIYFQAHQLIIKYNISSQTISQIYPQKSFQYMSISEGHIFVQDGTMLCEIDSGNKLTPVIDIADRIINVYQESGGKLILFLEHQGIFHLLPSKELIPINKATNAVLTQFKIFSCTPAADNKFLVGTTQNGLYILDSMCIILQNTGDADGLPSTTVLNAYADKGNNIWMGLDGGVALLNQGRGERFFSPSPPIGNIHDILKLNGQVFIGTNTGLYEMHPNGNCVLVKGTTGPVWSIYNIAGKLVYMHDLGVFTLENGVPECIHNRGATSLVRVTNDSNDFISSDYYGLSYYKLEGGKLTFIAKIKNFDGSVPRLYLDRYGFLWTIIRRTGFLRIQLSEDKLSVSSTKLYTHPDATSNLLLSTLDGNLTFFNGKVPFHYDIRSDSLINDRYAASIFKLCDAGLTSFYQFENTFWYQSPNDIGYVTRNGNQLEKCSGIFSSIYNKRIEPAISKLDSNIYVVGYQKGIAFYQMNGCVQNHLKIRMVEAYGVGEPVYHNMEEKYLKLPYNKHNINIYPTHLNSDKLIEYRILEMDTLWKTEQIDNALTITYLESGKYTIQLRNKADFKYPAQELLIRIDRPWLLSDWMIFTYAIGFMGIIILIVLYFKHKALKEKQWLEQNRRRKMEEMENDSLKQQQRISELEKEKLKIEIREKNKQMAIITMNEAKRNNLLIDLKKDIVSLEQSTEEGTVNIKVVKQTLKKIDMELNNKESWAIFEQYFNTIFDGLMDRLSAKYPQLTQSDLRLCAYLKLKMNNKEIADLLNISYRSVEVAKYRLRKKLGLELNDNFSALLNET